LQQQPLLCGLIVQFLIACLQFLMAARFLLTLPLCSDMFSGLPTMIKDPVVCGKADSICSSATVGKCNMGNPTTYPYNLSGQGMWQRISTLGHLFILILKLLFARPQMTATMCPSISVMPELELDSKGV
jgi:hypothetical protein